MPQGAAAAERIIRVEGVEHHFPADATDDDISQALAAEHDQSDEPPNAGLAPASGDPRRNPVLYRDQLRHEFTPHNPDDILGRGDTAENLAGYVDTGPVEMGRGAVNIGRGNIARGGHQVISGGMTTAAPAMLPLIPTAPLHAAAAMGTGYVGGKLTKAMAEESGLNPEQSEFAGDIGNVVGGYGGAKLTSPTIRGTGSLIKRVAGAPDLPTNIPSAPMTNFLLKAINSSRSGIGQVGRKMANYGIPQAPNVAPGPGGPPPEADLPAIRPDGSSHYNDVQDQGESNRLMDAVRGHDMMRPSESRSPVSPSGNSQYDDVAIANPEIKSAPDEDLISQVQRGAVLPSADAAKDVNSLDLIDRVQRGAVLPSAKAARTVNSLPTASPSPFTDGTPTPNSDTLLRAIQSAPGWPENGLPNKPWSMIHAESELPDALSTDPYNRPVDRQIQDPSYQGPERRGTSRPPDQSSGQYGGNPFPDLPPALPSARGRKLSSVTPATPQTYYHGTAATNVPSIMREGLDPSRNNTDYGPGPEHDEPQAFSFLGHNEATAADFTPGNPDGYANPDIKGAILKVNAPRKDLVTNLGEFVRSPNVIPPDQISLHKMIGPDRYTSFGPSDEPIPLGPSSLDQPGLAETTAASDPTRDGQALDQARQELPNGTLSDHLQRAAQIAASNRQGSIQSSSSTHPFHTLPPDVQNWLGNTEQGWGPDTTNIPPDQLSSYQQWYKDLSSTGRNMFPNKPSKADLSEDELNQVIGATRQWRGQPSLGNIQNKVTRNRKLLEDMKTPKGEQ